MRMIICDGFRLWCIPVPQCCCAGLEIGRGCVSGPCNEGLSLACGGLARGRPGRAGIRTVPWRACGRRPVPHPQIGDGAHSVHNLVMAVGGSRRQGGKGAVFGLVDSERPLSATVYGTHGRPLPLRVQPVCGGQQVLGATDDVADGVAMNASA